MHSLNEIALRLRGMLFHRLRERPKMHIVGEASASYRRFTVGLGRLYRADTRALIRALRLVYHRQEEQRHHG